MLWKFEFLVEDKYLSKVMWLLQGHVRDMQPPRPVVNAKTVEGKARAQHPNLLAALTTECRKHETVTPAFLKNYIVNIGYSPGSYSPYLTRLLEAGVLKPRSGDGTYKVIQPKAARPKVKAKPKRKAKRRKTARAHKANGNGVSPTA